ncbi:MAG: hypothetical protein B5M55_03730 [Desulfococcus sp. 4484_242]|nr:MAG: hypothetical protein B5M55_03730 [Desulfococcus sp. 4484_242]
MPEPTIDPKKLANFGRSFFLLFNRSTMYDANHPYCRQAVDDFLPIIQNILDIHSPLVFIMNQEQFFVDEEPVDPRINTSKMVAHFKKAEILSISFYKGLDRRETRGFVEIFTSLKKYPHVTKMKKGLEKQGIRHIKINHVFFKKVSTDEEIVSRETFEKMSSDMTDDSQVRSKKMFLDMVLESVLMEEFEKTLSIKNITENPVGLSKDMIQTDLSMYRQSEADDKQPGLALVHQLQMMEDVVEKHLSGFGAGGSGDGTGTGKTSVEAGPGTGKSSGAGGDGAELSELAAAVFEMKRQLINGIKLQQSLGITYPNEKEILNKADEITDRVLIRLIKEEYRSGQISAVRLARILKRLVPDANELKRLMPKIKKALLEEGMPLSDYLILVQELSNELQSEELSKILQESADQVGLDGSELIHEVRNNPVQAAELIFLAAEIRKGTGDEHVLTDLLVDYVERLGSKMAMDMAGEDGEEHLREVIGSIESQILGRLKNMDVHNDILDRLEKKLNSRIDEMFERLKDEWRAQQSDHPEDESRQDLSVLEILEESVEKDEELGSILRMVRAEAQSRGLDENDFKTIFEEISRQKEIKKKRKKKKILAGDILDAEGLKFFLEKEISRSLRYDLPFATLSFSIVSAQPKGPAPAGSISKKALVRAVMQKLATEIRGADMAAVLGGNKLVALLPMTPEDEAKLALKRHLRLLNTEPLEIKGVPVTMQVAGAATNFDSEKTPDAQSFIETLTSDLSEMVVRIKNIHGL